MFFLAVPWLCDSPGAASKGENHYIYHKIQKWITNSISLSMTYVIYVFGSTNQIKLDFYLK